MKEKKDPAFYARVSWAPFIRSQFCESHVNGRKRLTHGTFTADAAAAAANAKWRSRTVWATYGEHNDAK